MVEKQTPKTYETLIQEHQPMMYYTALKVVKDKHLAEDVVQESWIKIIKHNPTIYGIARLGAWLRTIATRTAIDMVRKDNTQKLYLFDEPCLIEELKMCSKNDTEEFIDFLGAYEELELCLRENKKMIEIFQMKFKQELDDQEIAIKLDISISAVKSRIFRTRKHIEKHKEKEMCELVKPGV